MQDRGFTLAYIFPVNLRKTRIVLPLLHKVVMNAVSLFLKE